MASLLSATEITIPALFLAGMQASGHCMLMCGVFNASAGVRAQYWLQLQAGRILTYSVLGILAGWLGGRLLTLLPADWVAGGWRVLLGLSIVALALLQFRRVGRPAHRVTCPGGAAGSRSQRSLWLRGLAWGLMPCPMVYAALLVAAVAGSPAWGGGLMLAFGLGTMPLLASQIWVLANPLSRSINWVVAHPAQRALAIGALGLLVVASGLWWAPQAAELCLP